MITQDVLIDRLNHGEVVPTPMGVSVAMALGKAPKVVIMTDKKKRTGLYKTAKTYHVTHLETPGRDGIGFTLHRAAEDVLPGEPTAYNVFLCTKPGGDLCDCKGFENTGRICKHIAATRAAVGDAQ